MSPGVMTSLSLLLYFFKHILGFVERKRCSERILLILLPRIPRWAGDNFACVWMTYERNRTVTVRYRTAPYRTAPSTVQNRIGTVPYGTSEPYSVRYGTVPSTVRYRKVPHYCTAAPVRYGTGTGTVPYRRYKEDNGIVTVLYRTVRHRNLPCCTVPYGTVLLTSTAQ
jgi:hypothetical protein